MKVALFVGGRGIRLFGDEAPRPKALLEIGAQPVIRHIIDLYMDAGINDFLLLLGYQGNLIADYFMNQAPFDGADVRVTGGGGGYPNVDVLQPRQSRWYVTLCPTGVDTEKGERLRRARSYLHEEPDFMATYGDGLSDIDMQDLLQFHRRHGKMATITAVRTRSQWGHLSVDDNGRVTDLLEKPPLDDWVNGGFFVFKREVLDFLEPGDTLESNCLPRLARDGELVAYRHEGFWMAMDTYKDSQVLNELFDSGQAPWKQSASSAQ